MASPSVFQIFKEIVVSILAFLLIGIGGLISLVGVVLFYIAAFKTSIIWGLCCLFLPFVGLVFLILHWDVAGKPFLIQLAGYVPVILGAPPVAIVLGGSTFPLFKRG